MKKSNILSKIAAFALSGVLLFGAVSCSNDLDGKASSQNSSRAATSLSDLSRTVELKLVVLGIPSTNTKPGVWAWAKAGSDINYSTKAWPGDLEMAGGTESNYPCYTYTLKVDPAYSLGILFNNLDNGGSPQTGDITIKKADIASSKTLYFNWNSMAYYTKIDDCIGIFGAAITELSTTAATVKLTTSLLTSVERASLTVKDADGNALAIGGSGDIAVSIDSATLTLSNDSATGSSVTKVPYTVTYNSKDLTTSIDMKLIDSLYGPAAKAVEGLGLTLNGTTATFKTWAPTASKVNVLLYTDSSAAYDSSKTTSFDSPGSTETDWGTTPTGDAIKAMTLDSSTGVWSLENVDVSSYKYYKYQITVAGKTYYVSDIWHTVAGPDSSASQIATIDDAEATPSSWESGYTNPFGSSGTEVKKYNDAVIYEMHIRDWSRAYNSTSTGKFKDIADALGTNGDGEFGKHLKELGVTHVQILPMFDYAQLNSNKNYNWGYNPYHYNVPEGRYVTDGYTDGTQAVKEAREMIKAFHDAGIAVIMDVVYNHTNGSLTGSLYDSTVPGYFYRQGSDGSYSNGSGCGNETASDRIMVQKYMIESLKHWVKDYHVNGFRFDLMGVHDKDTMKAIYDTLYELDKNILVYGEPWNGGASSLSASSRATSAGKGTSGYGYGAFDDDYRDAVKGAEFGGFNRGQIQGTYADSSIVLGLKGEAITKNSRNTTGITGLALHYAECHDNYTLFDKLVYSTDSSVSGDGDFAPKFANLYKTVMADETKLASIKKQNKLAAAYVLLGQGTPFINGGQEFMRTKKGNPDSYSADTKGGIAWTNTAGSYNIDDVNTIDLSLKDKFLDVYNVYKGLIHLRKDFKAFTDPSSTNASTLSEGVTKYTAEASDGSFTVVFNATDKDVKLSDTINGYIVDVETRLAVTGNYLGFGFADVDVDVDVEPYRIYKDMSSVSSVPAKSFVIIKK